MLWRKRFVVAPQHRINGYIGEGFTVKVRICDIAKAAGVSSASVSNALNGRKGVGDSTTKRIVSIAREMGYVHEKNPNRKFIRLVVFKRHGLVVMDTQFFAELIEAMGRQAMQLGYDMAVTHMHKEMDVDYMERIDSICHEECAGVVLLATEMFEEDIRLFEHTLSPLLVLDSCFHHFDFNTVVMDNYEAGYIATEHLIQMGHQAIDHITASVPFNNMAFRRQGYEDAMKKYGLPHSKRKTWSVMPTLEGAHADMASLLAGLEGETMPTAFFAANDIIALGCVRALKEAGYRVAEDVSVIGMDDLAISQIASPALSTIRVSREDIGRIVVRRLVEMMDREAPQSTQKTQVGVTLIKRDSVYNLKTE